MSVDLFADENEEAALELYAKEAVIGLPDPQSFQAKASLALAWEGLGYEARMIYRRRAHQARSST